MHQFSVLECSMWSEYDLNELFHSNSWRQSSVPFPEYDRTYSSVQQLQTHWRKWSKSQVMRWENEKRKHLVICLWFCLVVNICFYFSLPSRKLGDFSELEMFWITLCVTDLYHRKQNSLWDVPWGFPNTCCATQRPHADQQFSDICYYINQQLCYQVKSMRCYSFDKENRKFSFPKKIVGSKMFS
jgi:hypothetical protein